MNLEESISLLAAYVDAALSKLIASGLKAPDDSIMKGVKSEPWA